MLLVLACAAPGEGTLSSAPGQVPITARTPRCLLVPCRRKALSCLSQTLSHSILGGSTQNMSMQTPDSCLKTAHHMCPRAWHWPDYRATQGADCLLPLTADTTTIC